MTNNRPNNALAPRKNGSTPAATFSNFITGEGVKRKINEMVGGKDGQRFITSIISSVSNNPDLAECDHGTILSAAMLGESLKLSPSVQLGQFYLVPFKDRKNGRTVATFVLGYKGFIQLAIRSGQYKKLNVIAIKDGELKSYDPLNEELEVELIQDDSLREDAPTVGYYAMFEYMNGFRKTMYWSREKMEAHAKKYSPGYARDLQRGSAYTFWSKDFDGMAYKTMLRQIISKWGIMSIEIQQAIEGDNAMITDVGPHQYIDSAPIDTEQPAIEQKQPEAAKTEEPPTSAQDEFFDGQEDTPEPEQDPENSVGQEYTEMNAAERKFYLSKQMEIHGVPLAQIEKLLGKSYSQWTKKDRVALLGMLERIKAGEEVAVVLGTKEKAA